MRVTVHLFARLRELAGRADLSVDAAAGATIRDVWTLVASAHPALAPYESSVSCALNEDFARMSAVVKDGDAIAFLPPVSGGTHGARGLQTPGRTPGLKTRRSMNKND